MLISSALELGVALRGRREELKLTQQQIAQKAGISRALVIDLEQGKRPRAELLGILKLMRALEVAFTVQPDPKQDFDEVLAKLLGG